MTTALVVSRHFPFEPQRVHGVYQRFGTQVQALATVVDRVECLFFVPGDQDYPPEVLRDHEERLRALWSPAVSIRLAAVVDEAVPQSLWQRVGRGVFDFHKQSMARSISTAGAVRAVSAALNTRPDIVLAHRLMSMSVLMRVAREAPEKVRAAPLFFDMDDIEHLTLLRRLLRDPSWPAERLVLSHVPALMLAEIRALRLATTTFVCSDRDRRYLARFAPGRVRTVPNSVAFPVLANGEASEPLVLFVGAMGYRPNAQAADVLVQQIWPVVRAQIPDARLAIIGAGRELTASYRSSADPSVMFTGFVDDLQPWYRRARVVCCPIYHGGGTRVKIIEAAAHAKAVVSTRLGAEGLTFEDGREIIVCDRAAELAQAVVRLLGDPEAAARLGQAALRKARAAYERDAVVAQLADVFRTGWADGNAQRVRDTA